MTVAIIINVVFATLVVTAIFALHMWAILGGRGQEGRPAVSLIPRLRLVRRTWRRPTPWVAGRGIQPARLRRPEASGRFATQRQ